MYGLCLCMCVSTGASGVANRLGYQPAGQLPLHPGQQHCPTGPKNTHTRNTFTNA